MEEGSSSSNPAVKLLENSGKTIQRNMLQFACTSGLPKKKQYESSILARLDSPSRLSNDWLFRSTEVTERAGDWPGDRSSPDRLPNPNGPCGCPAQAKDVCVCMCACYINLKRLDDMIGEDK